MHACMQEMELLLLPDMAGVTSFGELTLELANDRIYLSGAS